MPGKNSWDGLRTGTVHLAVACCIGDGVTTAMAMKYGVFGSCVGKWHYMYKGRVQMNYITASGH